MKLLIIMLLSFFISLYTSSLNNDNVESMYINMIKAFHITLMESVTSEKASLGSDIDTDVSAMEESLGDFTPLEIDEDGLEITFNDENINSAGG